MVGSTCATLLLSALLIAISAREYMQAVGRHRRARLLSVWAAAGLSLVLVGGAAARLALPAGEVSTPALLAYELMLVKSSWCSTQDDVIGGRLV